MKETNSLKNYFLCAILIQFLIWVHWTSVYQFPNHIYHFTDNIFCLLDNLLKQKVHLTFKLIVYFIKLQPLDVSPSNIVYGSATCSTFWIIIYFEWNKIYSQLYSIPFISTSSLSLWAFYHKFNACCLGIKKFFCRNNVRRVSTYLI